MGFIRGAKADHRYDRKQAAELHSIKAPPILAQPVDLLKINLAPIQAWLDDKISEALGGIDDEVLSGMIGNILTDHQDRARKIKGPASASKWSPKELQHLLGSFLSEEGAAEFVERLWILLLDAQETTDGVPAAWGPADRSKYTGQQQPAQQPTNGHHERVILGAGPSMTIRSPERLVGQLIRDVRRAEEDHHDRRDRRRRYYDDAEDRRRSSYNDDRRRSRREMPSPERTPERRRRDSSADTYGSRTPPRHTRTPSPPPRRSEEPPRHNRRRTQEPLDHAEGDDEEITDLEQLLRQKARESMRQPRP